MIGLMVPNVFAETYTNEDMRFSIELPDEMKIKYFPAKNDKQVPFVEISGDVEFYDDFRIEIYYWGNEVYYSDKSENLKLEIISNIEKNLFEKSCDDAYKIVNEEVLRANPYSVPYEELSFFDYCDFLKQEFSFPNLDTTIFELEWFEVGPKTYSGETDPYGKERVRLQEIHIDNEKWEIQPDDGVWGLYFYSGNGEFYNSIVSSFTTFEDNDIKEPKRIFSEDKGVTCWSDEKAESVINKYTGNQEVRCVYSTGEIKSRYYDVSFRQDKITSSKYELVAEPEPEPKLKSLCGDGTILKNGQCVLDERGGGCLIATAAFGSEMAPQVQFLRELRDNTVLQTTSGTAFMNGFNQFYYSFSPQIADYERENPVFKEAVKVTLTPLLTSLTLLNYVEIDSEEEMLGYGIGIILLNVGMYFVAPAVLIISLKKRFL